jgi:hypothetical protein
MPMIEDAAKNQNFDLEPVQTGEISVDHACVFMGRPDPFLAPRRIVACSVQATAEGEKAHQERMNVWWQDWLDRLSTSEDEIDAETRLAESLVCTWRSVGLQEHPEASARAIGLTSITVATADAIQAALFAVVNSSVNDDLDFEMARFVLSVFIRAHPAFRSLVEDVPTDLPFGSDTKFRLVKLARHNSQF